MNNFKINNSHILSAAIGSLLVLGMTGNASAAEKKMEMEKCFGIAKTGMNDCSSSKSGHSRVGRWEAVKAMRILRVPGDPP